MAEPSGIMLHPICKRFPDSIETWEATNLPFSCVVTPLEPTPTTRDSQYHDENEDDDYIEKSRRKNERLDNLGNIPKCLSCGAPHPTVISQYPMHHALLCHLCGKTSRTSFLEQARRRNQIEVMSPDRYDNRPHKNTKSIYHGTDITEFSIPTTTIVPAQLPPSPARQQQQQQQEQPQSLTLFELDTRHTCPPLWWILVEASSSRKFWTTVAQAVQSSLQEAPPHVHVAISIYSSSTISIWDLTSPIPSIRNYAIDPDDGHFQNEEEFLPFCPLGPYKSNVQAALRALGDYHHVMETPNSTSSSGNGTIFSPLSSTLKLLLNTLEDAQHPGTIPTDGRKQQPRRQEQGEDYPLMYAGGRVLCFLNGPPAELGQSTSNITSQPKVPSDTFSMDPEAGTMQQDGHGDDNDGPNLADSNEMSASHVGRLFSKRKPNVEAEFAQLGSRLGRAAFGVDIIVLVNDDSNVSTAGLLFLTPLAESSGAPGPVIYNMTTTPNVSELLLDQVKSRVPWNGCCFGGLLRIRMSPGFRIDTSPFEDDNDDDVPRFASLHVKKGLNGPGTATPESGLWIMGICDEHSTVTLDLQVTNKIQQFTYIDGIGEVALKTALQVCFAYTTIVEDEDSGDYVTVRRMRIATRRMPLANHAETLYATMNVRALGVALYHKLFTSIFVEGLTTVQEIARNWLKVTMICCYNSAKSYYDIQQSRSLPESNPYFLAKERLLLSEGKASSSSDLTRTEVMLGQGHELLRLLPLLVWSLIHCEALSSSKDTTSLSMEERTARLSQMARMSPTVLSMYLNPRVELWASGDEIDGLTTTTEALVSDLPLLSMNALSLHISEQQQNSTPLLIFVTTPFFILVCGSDVILARGDSNNEVPVLGAALSRAVERAANSFPTRPQIIYALRQTEHHVARHLLQQCVLVQDAQTPMGGFAEWQYEVAKDIFEHLFSSSFQQE